MTVTLYESELMELVARAAVPIASVSAASTVSPVTASPVAWMAAVKVTAEPGGGEGGANGGEGGESEQAQPLVQTPVHADSVVSQSHV